MTPGLIKHFTAAAAIAPWRIVAFNGSGAAAQAAAATDRLFGVSDSPGASAGQGCDVILSDLAEVEYGGTVAAGDPLTADADGKAIKAAPAAGAKVRTIGTAMVSGAYGDRGVVLVERGEVVGLAEPQA